MIKKAKNKTWGEITRDAARSIELSTKESVNHPSHYQGKTEVIEIIEQLTEGMEGKKAFNLGNVIKYIFRHEGKGGVEDLKKAEWYLNRVIEEESNCK